MLLLLEPYLTPHLRYRARLLALSWPMELEPPMEIGRVVRATKVKQAEYRYLNYEPRRPLIVGKGIAGQRHHTMSRPQQRGGGTNQRHFLLYQCRDQDRILSNPRPGATRKRITVGRHLRIAPKGTRIECLESLPETTIS